MTYALGWALAQNPTFLNRFSIKLRLGGTPERHTLHLQKSRSGFGRTDIELVSPGLGTIVIEAKKGFSVPTTKQLEKYIRAHNVHGHPKAPLKSIVVLNSYPAEFSYQSSALPKKLLGIQVRYLSWRDVLVLGKRSLDDCTGDGKKSLRLFIEYLSSVAEMRDEESNQVYVVPLSTNTFGGGKTTFIDVVAKHSKYFHPVGNHYPTEPPNYIGFRYFGKLQSIHFVKKVDVITTFKKHFPDTNGVILEPHFLYSLGPAIQPPKLVKSGKIRNMRCYCALDTLLTEDSIQAALKESKLRRSK